MLLKFQILSLFWSWKTLVWLKFSSKIWNLKFVEIGGQFRNAGWSDRRASIRCYEPFTALYGCGADKNHDSRRTAGAKFDEILKLQINWESSLKLCLTDDLAFPFRFYTNLVLFAMGICLFFSTDKFVDSSLNLLSTFCF